MCVILRSSDALRMLRLLLIEYMSKSTLSTDCNCTLGNDGSGKSGAGSEIVAAESLAGIALSMPAATSSRFMLSVTVIANNRENRPQTVSDVRFVTPPVILGRPSLCLSMSFSLVFSVLCVYPRHILAGDIFVTNGQKGQCTASNVTPRDGQGVVCGVRSPGLTPI